MKAPLQDQLSEQNTPLTLSGTVCAGPPQARLFTVNVRVQRIQETELVFKRWRHAGGGQVQHELRRTCSQFDIVAKFMLDISL